MAGNPLIAQGTLNRLIASVAWSSFPVLNVTASYLAPEGIRLTLTGESTLFIQTMAGVVTSPEPYMMIDMAMHLLKSQPLSNSYKSQMELSALLGDGVVRTDTTTLGQYQITNCAIQGVTELDFSGRSAAYVVRIRGYYLTNSSLWG
jgi:hypothetical protein